ncbi:MAG: 5'-methylthioadenosine nucleosidase, partial [Bdellovibrionia bacterium]
KQAQIGDVYLSSEAIRYHDRRIPLPGFDAYGVGHFPVLHLSKMAHELGLKVGVVSTGNSLDCTEKDFEMIEENNGSIKEMEAAAIAYVAHQLEVPFFTLKAVTDLIDSGLQTGPEFLKNLDLACINLLTKTQSVLSYLAANPAEWVLSST